MNLRKFVTCDAPRGLSVPETIKYIHENVEIEKGKTLKELGKPIKETSRYFNMWMGAYKEGIGIKPNKTIVNLKKTLIPKKWFTDLLDREPKWHEKEESPYFNKLVNTEINDFFEFAKTYAPCYGANGRPKNKIDFTTRFLPDEHEPLGKKKLYLDATIDSGRLKTFKKRSVVVKQKKTTPNKENYYDTPTPCVYLLNDKGTDYSIQGGTERPIDGYTITESSVMVDILLLVLFSDQISSDRVPTSLKRFKVYIDNLMDFYNEKNRKK